MTVSITVDELAQAVRLTVGGAVEEPQRGILVRQLAAATAEIEQYADISTPDETLNAAAVRFVGFLYDSPSVPRGFSPVNPFENSGAKALLSGRRGIVSATVL